MSDIKIPKWTTLLLSSKPLTALENFIYDNEPSGYLAEQFRESLQAAVDEVYNMGKLDGLKLREGITHD
jgi:hypothetical protein